MTKDYCMKQSKICQLRKIYLAVSEFENSVIAHFGLNYNELTLLAILDDAKQCMSASDIAEQLGLKPSCTSKVIGSVEKKGYISRGFCKNDKRVIHFCLTDEGQKKIDSIDCSQVEIPEELQRLMDSIEN